MEEQEEFKSPIRIKGIDSGEGTGRVFHLGLQLSIFIFAASLVWFAFVFYPKTLSQYRKIPLSQDKPNEVLAQQASNFPAENDYYRISYENGSNTYYVFVKGGDLAQYVENKNSATLALKNALSLEDLCETNVIFTSSEQLKVPDNLKSVQNC